MSDRRVTSPDDAEETSAVSAASPDGAASPDEAPAGDREVYGVPELDEASSEDDEAWEDEENTPSETLARVLNLGVGLVVALFVALLAIVAPQAGSQAQDVPVGAVGDEATIEGIGQMLDQNFPGVYDVRSYEDDAALQSATQAREIYGGWVLDEQQPGTYVATAADSEQAGLLEQMLPTNVTDVAATTAQDPDALGVTVAAVLLAVAGLGLALGLRQQLPGRVRAQGLGAVALSVVLGLALSGALHGLGSVAGSFWSLAGTAALGALASTLVAVGLLNLAGLAGGAIALFVVTLPGIGLAGLWQLPESVPGVWGGIGQHLPTGAAGRLLQSSAYFDGGGALRPGLVLLAWVVAGALLVVLGALVVRRAGERDAALSAAEAEVAALDAEDEPAAAQESAEPEAPAGSPAEPADGDAEMPDEDSGATVEDMTDENDDRDSGGLREPQPGRADWFRKGGAQAEDRPEQSGEDQGAAALESPAEVQGDEGGGDPAAGAQEDATGGAETDEGPDGGHRSGRDV